ncbi:MAG: hypothetical protein HY461_02680 [Parcubacteria group bacterium]|nr:hypothetical protein [Parcubacteria group bacterium]
MKKMRHRALASLVMAAALATTLLIGSAALAQGNGNQNNNGNRQNSSWDAPWDWDAFSTDLSARLAVRFNLNQADVEAFLLEQHWVDIKARLSVRLDQAVTKGKITAAQKTVILAKFDDVTDQLDDMRNLSDADRRQALKDLRAELKTWAKTQGINTSVFTSLFFNGNIGAGHHGWDRSFWR